MAERRYTLIQKSNEGCTKYTKAKTAEEVRRQRMAPNLLYIEGKRMMLKNNAKMPVILSAKPIRSDVIPSPPSWIFVALKMGKSSSKAIEWSDKPE
jgi:hypothetical protein